MTLAGRRGAGRRGGVDAASHCLMSTVERIGPRGGGAPCLAPRSASSIGAAATPRQQRQAAAPRYAPRACHATAPDTLSIQPVSPSMKIGPLFGNGAVCDATCATVGSGIRPGTQAVAQPRSRVACRPPRRSGTARSLRRSSRGFAQRCGNRGRARRPPLQSVRHDSQYVEYGLLDMPAPYWAAPGRTGTLPSCRPPRPPSASRSSSSLCSRCPSRPARKASSPSPTRPPPSAPAPPAPSTSPRSCASSSWTTTWSPPRRGPAPVSRAPTPSTPPSWCSTPSLASTTPWSTSLCPSPSPRISTL